MTKKVLSIFVAFAVAFGLCPASGIPKAFAEDATTQPEANTATPNAANTVTVGDFELTGATSAPAAKTDQAEGDYELHAKNLPAKPADGSSYTADKTKVYDSVDVLEIHAKQSLTIKNKDDKKDSAVSTVIKVTNMAQDTTLTLAGVNILGAAGEYMGGSTDEDNVYSHAPFEMDNSTNSFSLTLIIADDTTNTLNGLGIGKDSDGSPVQQPSGCAGIEKDDGTGTLADNVLTIKGAEKKNGILNAYGDTVSGAGIGGGSPYKWAPATSSFSTDNANGDGDGATDPELEGTQTITSSSYITIESGVVNAFGGTPDRSDEAAMMPSEAAGIGGGGGDYVGKGASAEESTPGSGRHITITGGTVNAASNPVGGSCGAGIGGGFCGNGTDIQITGGNVFAFCCNINVTSFVEDFAGSFIEMSSGSGIGGGGYGYGKDIQVSGGSVKAFGNVAGISTGAGIGGGQVRYEATHASGTPYPGSGTNITISGGDVLAASSGNRAGFGAGIGGGAGWGDRDKPQGDSTPGSYTSNSAIGGKGESITVSGGNVHAYSAIDGDAYGAAIGGGSVMHDGGTGGTIEQDCDDEEYNGNYTDFVNTKLKGGECKNVALTGGSIVVSAYVSKADSGFVLDTNKFPTCDVGEADPSVQYEDATHNHAYAPAVGGGSVFRYLKEDGNYDAAAEPVWCESKVGAASGNTLSGNAFVVATGANTKLGDRTIAFPHLIKSADDDTDGGDGNAANNAAANDPAANGAAANGAAANDDPVTPTTHHIEEPAGTDATIHGALEGFGEAAAGSDVPAGITGGIVKTTEWDANAAGGPAYKNKLDTWTGAGEDNVITIDGNVTLPVDTEIPANGQLMFGANGKLTIPDGVTLKNCGAIHAAEGNKVGCIIAAGTGKLTTSVAFNDNTNDAALDYVVYTGGAQKTYADSNSGLKAAPTAPQGKVFKGWYTATTGGTKIENTTAVEANVHTLHAQYKNEGEGEPHAVNAPADLQGGSVSFEGLTEGKALKDATVTIVAAPAAGKKVTDGSVKAINKTSQAEVAVTKVEGQDNKYTFVMPDAEVDVQIAFEDATPEPGPGPDPEPEPQPVTPPSADDTPGGTVTVEGLVDGKAVPGQTYTINTTPQEGKKVKPDSVKVTEKDTGKDVAVTKVDDEHYTFVMPEHGVDIAVEFEDAEPTPEPPAPVESVKIWRMYNASTGEHLYTKDNKERDALVKGGGWIWEHHQKNWDGSYQEYQWLAPKTGSKAVYRLYNPTSDDHLYTSDMKEIRVQITQGGWKLDGNIKGKQMTEAQAHDMANVQYALKFYSADAATGVPLLRQLNNFTTQHNYTMDQKEENNLVKNVILNGEHVWTKERPSFYGLKVIA